MAGGLDAALNFLVPIGVFILFGFIMWRAFGNEISGFVSWIKEMWSPSPEVPQVQNQYSNKRNIYGWDSGGGMGYGK
jgi:hypothetical protein